MFHFKSIHKNICQINSIRSKNIIRNYGVTQVAFTKIQNSENNISETISVENHINPFGIPLLHQSLEKKLFGNSKKIKNDNLKEAYEHLSTFNIKVDDVENGKMHSFTIHTRGVICHIFYPYGGDNYILIFR